MPLLNQKAFLVTDKEVAIREAVKIEMPGILLLRCWNHLFSNINEWIRKHDGKRIDQGFYLNEIKYLIKSDTKEEYEKKLKVRINS